MLCQDKPARCASIMQHCKVFACVSSTSIIRYRSRRLKPKDWYQVVEAAHVYAHSSVFDNEHPEKTWIIGNDGAGSKAGELGLHNAEGELRGAWGIGTHRCCSYSRINSEGTVLFMDILFLKAVIDEDLC